MKLRSLILAAFLALPFASSFAQVGISVNVAPPPLPVVEQPPAPAEGYIWTPGYWGYDSDYYWVPGVWVAPPTVGLLWTPSWWGWNNGAYVFNQGYWGPHVGFYGGINYGYGYTGNGYWGGRWNGNRFQYNTAVTNVNKTVIHNTYVNKSFKKNVNINRTSFNGPNGVKAQPTAEQKAAAANAKKMPPTSQQLERQEAAKKDSNLHAAKNGQVNNEAIKSFNQTHDQGKGGENVGGAGAAGAGKAENVTGEQHAQGAGLNGEEHGNKHAADNEGNAHAGENVHGNNHNVEGNQAGTHNKGVQHERATHGQQVMNHQQQINAQHHQQQMAVQHHQQQMGALHHQQQMAAQHHPQMQGGGNRPPPPPKGQPQGKKKPDKP
jgi:hypothetical protein